MQGTLTLRSTESVFRALKEPEHNRAIDNESAGAPLRSARSSDGARLDQCQNLEFVDYPRAPSAVDGLLRPFADVDIPQRAIVRRHRGNSAQHIQRTTAIGEGAEQTLTLRI